MGPPFHANEASLADELDYASQASHTNDRNIRHQLGFSGFEAGDPLGEQEVGMTRMTGCVGIRLPV